MARAHSARLGVSSYRLYSVQTLTWKWSFICASVFPSMKVDVSNTKKVKVQPRHQWGASVP